MKITPCRDCGKNIQLLKTPTGRFLAVNPLSRRTGVVKGNLGAQLVMVYDLHKETCSNRSVTRTPEAEEPTLTVDQVAEMTFPPEPPTC